MRLQHFGSVSEAWMPKQPARQQSPTAEKLITDGDGANVCARVQRKECCAYLGVHASIYTLVTLNAA